MHGHKHQELRATDESGSVMIFGVASSTLGAEVQGKLDGVTRFAAVHLSLEGEWIIKLHTV